jgi:hypothetical protein
VKRFISTALGITFVLATTLAAQTRGSHGALPIPGHPDGLAGGLGLSPACIEALALSEGQTSSLAQLSMEHHAAVQTLVDQRMAYHDQIESALQAAAPDPAAIGKLVIADHGVAVQIQSSRTPFRTRFEALLSTEQSTTYTSLRENGVCADRGHPPR